MMIFIFFSVLAWADSNELSTVALKKVIEAKNPQQLNAIKAQWTQIEVDRRACALQIRNQLPPVVCFEAAEKERLWGLISQDDYVQRVKELDQICVQSSLPEDWQEKHIKSDALSIDCRESLSRAFELREYQASGLARILKNP